LRTLSPMVRGWVMMRSAPGSSNLQVAHDKILT
jgi:hypothetical protein